MADDIILFKEKGKLFFKKICSKDDLNNPDNKDCECEGYFIDLNGNEKETRRIVDALKGKKKLIAVKGYDNFFNRRVIETMKINYLVSCEIENKRDTLKQRDSGINHVLAMIAREKGILFVFDLSEIKKLGLKEKGVRLSRILQNIRVCRKAGAKIKIASFAVNKNELIDKKGREILLFSLGASSEQVNESCRF